MSRQLLIDLQLHGLRVLHIYEAFPGGLHVCRLDFLFTIDWHSFHPSKVDWYVLLYVRPYFHVNKTKMLSKYTL